MLYKLMIVEDESIIREGLCTFPDWKSMGFEVVANFEDGSKAIKYLNSNHIDVVLTDVKMTKVSGLELARYINENNLNISVVIISGYKDFNYAKEAIDYKVENYILKPVKFDEINNIFEKIKEKLDNENMRNIKAQQEDERYKEILPLLQNQFFSDLIAGALNNECDIKRRIELLELNINYELSKCCVVGISVKDVQSYVSEKWKYGKQRWTVAMKNIFSENSNDIQCFPVDYSQNDICVVVLSSIFDFPENMKSFIEKHFDGKKELMKKLFDLDCNIRTGNIYNNIFELSKSNLLPNYTNKVPLEQDENPIALNVYKKLIKNRNLFITCINSGSINDVFNLFDKCIDELESFDIKFTHYFITDLFATIYYECKKMNIDLLDENDEKYDYHEVYKISSLNQICVSIKKVLAQIIDKIVDRRNASTDFIIVKVKEYINENYNKDISLDDAAKEVHLSSTYFSQFFKEKSGINFCDYLTEVRMKKACELLEKSQHKVHEISEMVGYKSSKYFTKRFKEYTGYTPMEYIRRF